jgi:hypothetical protein
MKNFHLIEVKYLGATNNKGSRVKLTSLRFPNDSITTSLNYKNNSIKDDAIELFNELDFRITGYGYDERKGVFIFCSETFEPLKEFFKKQ